MHERKGTKGRVQPQADSSNGKSWHKGPRRGVQWESNFPIGAGDAFHLRWRREPGGSDVAGGRPAAKPEPPGLVP